MGVALVAPENSTRFSWRILRGRFVESTKNAGFYHPAPKSPRRIHRIRRGLWPPNLGENKLRNSVLNEHPPFLQEAARVLDHKANGPKCAVSERQKGGHR